MDCQNIMNMKEQSKMSIYETTDVGKLIRQRNWLWRAIENAGGTASHPSQHAECCDIAQRP
jgi:hypothetical protein